MIRALRSTPIEFFPFQGARISIRSSEKDGGIVFYGLWSPLSQKRSAQVAGEMTELCGLFVEAMEPGKPGAQQNIPVFAQQLQREEVKQAPTQHGIQYSGGRAVGAGGQGSGVGGQESGVRSQESEVRGQESEVRSQESGVRGQESGVRSQKAGEAWRNQ